MFIKTLFTPDHVRYDGVRPINIYLLRFMYFLMFAFVGSDSWSAIIGHQGPWEPLRAVAFCVWATYATLSVLGLLHPLRMLPILVFMVGYKMLWLVVVALPLWRAGTLAGSPAEPLTMVFLWIPLAIIAVPWGYFVRTFVLPRRSLAA